MERAAKLINTKNKLDQIRLPAMLLKIFGMVINKSSGPAPGFTSYAKQAGKIISPEEIATKVLVELIGIGRCLDDFTGIFFQYLQTLFVIREGGSFYTTGFVQLGDI